MVAGRNQRAPAGRSERSFGPLILSNEGAKHERGDTYLGTKRSHNFCHWNSIQPSTMSTGDYKVADISLADYGRKEIEIAEIESESWSLRTKEDRRSVLEWERSNAFCLTTEQDPPTPSLRTWIYTPPFPHLKHLTYHSPPPIQ